VGEIAQGKGIFEVSFLRVICSVVGLTPIMGIGTRKRSTMEVIQSDTRLLSR